jgi:hypothetical protein
MLTARGSEGVFPSFACSDAHGILDLQYEYFSIPDLARMSAFPNGLHYFFALLVGNRNFDLAFGQKVDAVFRAAIALNLTLLPPGSPHVSHGQSGDADFGEFLFDILKPMGSNDGQNKFHNCAPQ